MTPNAIEAERCPISGDVGVPYGATVRFDDIEAFSVFKCGACGHVWMPGKASLADATAQGIVGRGDTTSAEWVLNHLPPDVVSNDAARVLDIGCWDGEVLAGLPKSWERSGVELNRQAAAAARKKGLVIFDEPIEQCRLENARYDLVLMMDVLEHLDDPLFTMKKVAELLACGGSFFALTGNAKSLACRLYKGKWYYLNYAEHVASFSPSSLKITMEKAGLKLERIRAVVHPASSRLTTMRKLAARMDKSVQANHFGIGRPLRRREAVLLGLSRVLKNRDHIFVVAKKIN